jgi:hypothetical protein
MLARRAVSVLRFIEAAIRGGPVVIEDISSLMDDAHAVIGGDGWQPRRPRAHAVLGRAKGEVFLRE